jgi:signal transduction histidine kinase
VRTRLDGERIQVEIEDNGRGMPPEVLGSLFDFHFSVHERVHLGMGLKVAYAVVQKHGGTLSATSPGRGTRVTVTLPATGMPE